MIGKFLITNRENPFAPILKTLYLCNVKTKNSQIVKTNKTHTVMKKTFLAASLLTLLLTSCATYTGQGAFIGANIGGLLGSAIGGSAAGWRGSDMGTLVGMAGGAAVGAAIGQAADLFDVQPACHVIADNHKYNMSKKVIKDVGFCIVEKCHKLPKETEKL